MQLEVLKSAQPENLKILYNSYKKSRLAHAYIFEGEAGTKKFDTALFFAAMLLCTSQDEKPCGECNTCKRVENLTHSNVYVVKPVRNTITKDAIKSLQVEFNKTALEDGAKIYIIDNAETMNAHASNALLKFLEEPHPNIYALLLTTNSSKLLPTIRSRSQKLHFHTLSEKIIYDELIEQGFEPDIASIAASMHQTTIAAERFLSQENIYDVLDITYNIYQAIASKDSLVLMFDKEIYGVIKTTEDYQLLLDIMIYYQKDLIYGKMKHYQKQRFKAQKDTIETLLSLKSKPQLLEELEYMLDLKERLNNYINARLAFDNLMILLERRNESEE